MGKDGKEATRGWGGWRELLVLVLVLLEAAISQPGGYLRTKSRACTHPNTSDPTRNLCSTLVGNIIRFWALICIPNGSYIIVIAVQRGASLAILHFVQVVCCIPGTLLQTTRVHLTSIRITVLERT